MNILPLINAATAVVKPEVLVLIVAMAIVTAVVIVIMCVLCSSLKGKNNVIIDQLSNLSSKLAEPSAHPQQSGNMANAVQMTQMQQKLDRLETTLREYNEQLKKLQAFIVNTQSAAPNYKEPEPQYGAEAMTGAQYAPYPAYTSSEEAHLLEYINTRLINSNAPTQAEFNEISALGYAITYLREENSRMIFIPAHGIDYATCAMATSSNGTHYLIPKATRCGIDNTGFFDGQYVRNSSRVLQLAILRRAANAERYEMQSKGRIG